MAEATYKVRLDVTGADQASNKVASAMEKGITRALDTLGLGGITRGVSAAGGGEDEVAGGVGIALAATGVVTLVGALLSMVDMLTPFIRIMKALVMVFLLPAMPFLKLALQAMAGLVKFLLPRYTDIMNAIQGIINFFGTAGNIMEWLKGVIFTGWEVLLTIGSWVIDNIIKPAFSAFVGIGSWIVNNVIKPAFNGIIGIGNWIFNTITAGFAITSTWGQKLWDMLQTPFKSISDVVGKIADFIKGVINGAIGFANSFLPKGFKIPKLAEGGIVTSPTLAMIGENGPEAVIPLSKNGGTTVGKNVTVNINIDRPSVRDERDIKELVRLIGIEQQKAMRRYVSYTG